MSGEERHDALAAESAGLVYTRAAVDEYRAAVEARRQALESEITAARARALTAAQIEHRLSRMEQHVGAWVLAAYARTWPAPDGVSGDAQVLDLTREHRDEDPTELGRAISAGDERHDRFFGGTS